MCNNSLVKKKAWMCSFWHVTLTWKDVNFTSKEYSNNLGLESSDSIITLLSHTQYIFFKFIFIEFELVLQYFYSCDAYRHDKNKPLVVYRLEG